MPRASTQRPPAKFTRFPVVSLGAEHLVMGYLMRRNILAYKAPPNNEGYDLICIHPDPLLCPVYFMAILFGSIRQTVLSDAFEAVNWMYKFPIEGAVVTVKWIIQDLDSYLLYAYSDFSKCSQ